MMFPDLLHIMVQIGKDWNSRVCSQETPGLLDPAIPRFTRISISAFLSSTPLRSCREVLLWTTHHKIIIIQFFSCLRAHKLWRQYPNSLDMGVFVQMLPSCFSHLCKSDYTFLEVGGSRWSNGVTEHQIVKSRSRIGYFEESNWACLHLSIWNFFSTLTEI